MTPAQEKIKLWRDDPVQFVRDNFDVEPDAWQAIALGSFASGDKEKTRIALRACAGPGKSAALAWMGWNFLGCYGDIGAHPKGAVVAITADNLKDNLWPEFAKWQSKSEYIKSAFTWTGSRIFAKDHPETWFLSSRSWPKTANEEEQGRTLSGIHSDFVLFLIDESGDIPVQVLKSAEQALSSCKWGKIVQAGNPTSMAGMLYAACSSQAERWFSLSITGDPDDPNRSPRIKVEWAREQIALYGRTDPWVMAYILGQFPPMAVNALVSEEQVQAAMQRVFTEAMVANSQKRIGVDCARFGDDRTFIARRQGLAHLSGKTMRHADGPEIAGAVAEIDAQWGGADLIFVDGTGGYGASPEDSLKMAHYKPFMVNFSSRQVNNPRYYNKRTEIICEFCDAIKRGASLPNSPQLKKELLAHTYYMQDGKIRVIEKDQVKVILKCSPDEMEGYAVTYALPDRPKETIIESAWKQVSKPTGRHPWDMVNGEQGEQERNVPL